MQAQTPAERKAAQRRRDRAAGWRELLVKVHKDDVTRVKRYINRLRAERSNSGD